MQAERKWVGGKNTQITHLQRNKLVHNIYGHNIRYEYLKDVYRGPYIF